jgi:hypothetical protein
VSDAPDLIVRFQPDGDTNFVNELIWPGTPPQDLFVYGRIHNQGPAAALNVTMSVVLARFQGDQVLNSPSLYPQDFFVQDWALPLGTYLSSRSSLGAAWVASVPANSPVIIGPVIVPVNMVPWAQVSFGPSGLSFVGLLARIHVDNDDGNGGADNGCPSILFTSETGQAASNFSQTNKAAQRWLFSLGLAIPNW